MLKKEVLRDNRDFSRIYKKGKSVGDRYVVLFVAKNNLGYSRKAFLASKKVGNSVKRNRARRLIRESLRLSNYEIPDGYDYIFIARNTINGKGYKEVSKSVNSAIRRSGVLKDGEK